MPDQLTDAVLRETLVNGPQPTRVTIVGYDLAWPDRYRVRAAQIRDILGERALLIEHIGSTWVPGLAAKPIVDIAIGIGDPEDEDAYLRDLERGGYALQVREPRHRMLRAGEPDAPVNLHCYPPDDVEIRRYLAFRDRLRANTADRALYAATKHELAERDWPDVNYYAEAKTSVITAILARAGWHEGNATQNRRRVFSGVA